ncbi:MAG: type II secretion system F family protein [Anaerobutyricum sp.]|jgi:tight adherence protein B
MSYIHIIVLFEIFIFLIALYFIMKIHMKNSRISIEKDFIDMYIESIEKMIEKAGVSLSIKTYLIILIVAPLITGIIVYFLSQNAVFSVLIGAFGLFTPRGIVALIAYDNQKKFEERYAKSLRQLSASLEAGSSILNAVTEVSACPFLHDTIRKKYAKLSSDLMMGVSVTDAFKSFAEGTNSQDAEDVALAIDVQNAVGGHEADVIRDISNNIYSRIMLRRETKSILTDTTIMVRVFDILPYIIIIGFTMLNKQFIEIYFSNPVYVLVYIGFLVTPLIGSLLNHRTIKKIKKGA